jgi:protein-S-isoprenylcysteine O-methyltransferase Ste14
MSNNVAYVILFVLTVLAFILAAVVTRYDLYLSSSELAGYWMVAFIAIVALMITTREMSRQSVRVTFC